MKNKTLIIPLLLGALLIGFASITFIPAQAQSTASTVSPTSTYDPFAQPPLPENPTQLELGRYLFWRYCMPCHGDVGQGLTDEFRLEWEPTHQNCWARGCHSGKYRDDSFAIPTVVPPNVRPGFLDKYTPDSLFQFLRTTHPPEAPGSLTDDEYHALVAILYHMNGVPFPVQEVTATITPTAASTPLTTSTFSASLTPTSSPPPLTQVDSPLVLVSAIGLAILLTLLVLFRQKRK